MVSLAIDVSVVVQIVNFLLLMLVLNYFLYRPLRKIIRDRADVFAGLRSRAANLQDDLAADEARIKEYTTDSVKLALEKKAFQRSKGMDAQKELVTRIKNEAAADLELARQKITEDVTRAKADLDKEIQNFAWEIAGKILGRSL